MSLPKIEIILDNKKLALLSQIPTQDKSKFLQLKVLIYFLFLHFSATLAEIRQ